MLTASFSDALDQIPFNTIGSHPAVEALCLHWCVADGAFAEAQLTGRIPLNFPKKQLSVRFAGFDTGSAHPFFSLITKPDRLDLIDSRSAGLIIDTRLFPATSEEQIDRLLFSLSQGSIPVFINADQLLQQLKGDSFFGLQADFRFSPAGDPPSSSPSNTTAIAILLTVVWLWFSFRYYSDPTYRKSISRFFFNHSFHASDVFNRRLRITHSAWVLSVQSALLFGLALETLFRFVVTPAEREILTANVPLIAAADSLIFGFFIAGAAAQSALILLSLIWLRFGLPGARSFGQILPIYAWTFHIHLVVIPLIIVMCVSGWTLAFVTFWAVVVLTGLTLLSFYIVAWDVLRMSPSKSRLIYSRTIAPYTVMVSGFYLALYLRSSLLEAIVYAANIP